MAYIPTISSQTYLKNSFKTKKLINIKQYPYYISVKKNKRNNILY